MVTHGDVVTAARAVRHLCPEARRQEILRYLDRAHSADLFRKRTGKPHPFWGNGSLHGAIGPTVPTEPFLSDTSHLEAMAAVIETLLDWKHRKT
jgi:hypothetical protein